MKRRLALGGALFVVVVAIIAFCLHVGRNRVILTNESGQTIRVITISVGGQTIVFDNVKPGASVSAPFLIRGDDHFEVRGELADHTKVSDDCGYVTGGMWGERSNISINAKGNVNCVQGANRA